MFATQEDARYLEAILCAFVHRAGGSVTLPAKEIMDCGNGYELSVRADWEAKAVELRVKSV